jgi:hypothetical protein
LIESLSSISADDLKMQWKNMMKMYHPDNPDNHNKSVDVGLINAAYDSIRKAKENTIVRQPLHYTPPASQYTPPSKPTTPKIYKFDVVLSSDLNLRSREVVSSFRSWLEARQFISIKYPYFKPIDESVEVANRIYSDGRMYICIKTNSK